MNTLDKQYTDLLQDILDNGVTKQDRTGTGTLSVFGRQIRHKMSEGFPLITTKKMYFKGIVTELLWFLRGDTNIKYLVDNDCHIWDGDAYKNYEKITNDFQLENPIDDFIIKTLKGEMIKIETEDGDDYRILTQEEFINKIKTDADFANKWGELGPIYGKQWRKWRISERRLKWSQLTEEQKLTVSKETLENTHPDVAFFGEEKGIDQIANLINDLKTNPDSRRLLVSAWNPTQLGEMILPPCHYGFQVYTRELSREERIQIYVNQYMGGVGKPAGFEDAKLTTRNIPTRAISLMFNMRSNDVPLGLPFNLASYGLLLEILAKQVNMIPDELIANLGDTHIYLNQIDGVKEQLIREPYPLPKLKIIGYPQEYLNPNDERLCDEFEVDDFVIENYQSHPTIKMPLSN